MGWSFPWASAAPGDFNADFGKSRSQEETQEAVAPMLEAGVPATVEKNASASGTDVVGYLTEGPGLSVFIKEGDEIFQTYTSTARGLEFSMTFYGILDRAPKGRDEEGIYQGWMRYHDEY
jgi:predicted dithiol-disulfide oxidoreductase (DUF899 family)